MHIAFKFLYIHNNGLFNRLLARINECATLPLSCYQEEDVYHIEASGDQEELENLATLVSSMVPQSLFLRESTLEAIDALHVNPLMQHEKIAYETPCCPECHERILNTLNPFESCHVCGFSEQHLSLEDIGGDGESEAFFRRCAETLIAEEHLELLTYNGLRRFSLLSTQESENQGILVTDPSHISKSFLITQGELDVLMMIEKPSVRLKPKVLFHHEYDLKQTFYPVFFPDDGITLALSIALSQRGVTMLYCDHIPSLRVASALGEYPIISSGRDIQADDTKGEYRTLDAVIAEHHLEKESLCSIYLSREYPPHICSLSEKIGYTKMVDFSEALLNAPEMMLQAIRMMDDAGERLVENFKTAFPELYEHLIQVRFKEDDKASMFCKLWAVGAHIIGVSEVNEYRRACEMLEATALEFQGKSGPRIDYKLLHTNEGYQLDSRLVIRSAMSFKLAGVDEFLLSFGFIDSLADFLAEKAEFADGNIGIKGVALSGSLFENHQLLMRTYNAITPNYKIYRNERRSIDVAP
jgi:hypothetical protein